MPSTVIETIAYRSDAQVLDVLFTTGRRYLFHAVPPEVAEDFRRARIKGRHFNARIRGRYAFSEVEAAREVSVPWPESSPRA
ncbi:MAG TPA: KTSC domain-containing protein [Allosphingosinicella sp.]|jgi:lysyl-tRNA synthetase class 2